MPAGTAKVRLRALVVQVERVSGRHRAWESLRLLGKDHRVTTGRQTVVRTGNLQPRTSVRPDGRRIGLTPEVGGLRPIRTTGLRPSSQALATLRGGDHREFYPPRRVIGRIGAGGEMMVLSRVDLAGRFD